MSDDNEYKSLHDENRILQANKAATTYKILLILLVLVLFFFLIIIFDSISALAVYRLHFSFMGTMPEIALYGIYGGTVILFILVWITFRKFGYNMLISKFQFNVVTSSNSFEFVYTNREKIKIASYNIDKLKFNKLTLTISYLNPDTNKMQNSAIVLLGYSEDKIKIYELLKDLMKKNLLPKEKFDGKSLQKIEKLAN